MFSLFVIVYILFLSLIFFFGIKKTKYFSAENPTEIKYFYSLFVIILFIAVLLRIINLNFNSYWIDELFSINTASFKSASEVISECREDVHPPLYQLILHYYTGFAGSSEIASRLLSAIFGILSTAGIYLITKLLFDTKKALAVMLMFSVAYMPVYYSQEVRSYSLLLMLTLFTNYFFLKAFILAEHEIKYKILHTVFYCISSVLLMYTHYYGIPVIVFNFCFLTFCFFMQYRFGEFIKNILKTIPIYLLVAAVYYFSWGYVIAYQYQRTFWPKIGDRNIFSAFVFYVLTPNLKNYFINDLLLQFVAALMCIFLIYYFFKTVKCKFNLLPVKKYYYSMLFLLFWIFIPYVISFLQTVFSNPSISFRNLIILSPAVIIILYSIVEKSIDKILKFITERFIFLTGKFKLKYLTVNPMILSVILSMFLFVKTYGYYSYPTKHDIRSIIKEISEDYENRGDSTVMFTTSKTSDQLNYYFKRFSPKLRIKSYLAGESLENELIKFKDDFLKNDFLILFDLKNWGKDSDKSLNFFKSKYTLEMHKESEGFDVYVFDLKK